jgi:hypothetical protein
MNSMRLHLLRLAGIGVVAIALPQLASASDDANGGVVRLAMGPVSAALKNQGQHATSETTVPGWKPHHHRKHWRAARR